MRKGRDGEKREKNGGGKKREKTDENSGHYVIASSRPPERRPLERQYVFISFTNKEQQLRYNLQCFGFQTFVT